MRIARLAGPSRRRFVLIVIVLAALALTIEAGVQVATHDGSRRVLWSGTDVPGHIGARFRFFDGSTSRAVRAEAGERLVLDYRLEPTTGTLTLAVRDRSDHVLWSRRADRASQGSVALALPASGRYRVAVTGARSRGSFDVRYRTVTAGGGTG